MSKGMPGSSRRPRRRINLLLPLALGLAACAGPEHFRPAESATAVSPEGYSAAQYPIIIEGNVAGEAKVWTVGAYREKGGDGARTMLHVGFALENNGNQPMWLDASDIELVSGSTSSGELPPLRPVKITGTPDVPPGGDGEVHAYFELPPYVKPGKIDSFRLRWSVHTPNGQYAQRTPFLEQPPIVYTSAPYFYSPYYDPFYSTFPFYNQVVVVPARSIHH